MTETTITFENMREVEKTYRIGDKFLYDGDILMLVPAGNNLAMLVSVLNGARTKDPVLVQNLHAIDLGQLIGYCEKVEEFKHIENVEIVVKG